VKQTKFTRNRDRNEKPPMLILGVLADMRIPGREMHDVGKVYII
jgi:hypothetical protein